MRHNVYFGGRVQSLGLSTRDSDATVGVITPGHYTFSTTREERVVISSGELRIKLPDEDWRGLRDGESYTVPAGCAFEVDAAEDVPPGART